MRTRGAVQRRGAAAQRLARVVARYVYFDSRMGNSNDIVCFVYSSMRRDIRSFRPATAPPRTLRGELLHQERVGLRAGRNERGVAADAAEEDDAGQAARAGPRGGRGGVRERRVRRVFTGAAGGEPGRAAERDAGAGAPVAGRCESQL